MKKILFVDTETTGLDPVINGVHQVSGQIVIEGQVTDEFDFKFRPLPSEKIEEEALRKSNITVEELMNRSMDSREAYAKFDSLLAGRVDRYNKHDKLVIAGYNCNFDAQMLNSWFGKHKNPYFFGLCHGGAYLDGLTLALILEIKHGRRIFFPDRKLGSVAKILDIPLENAHDALEDIRATRQVIKVLWKRLGL